MIDPKEIEKVFGGKFIYDDYGQMVFGVHDNPGHQIALNVEDACLSVRGWGSIENIFGCKDGERFQDAFGRWVVEAMNEKLNRCLTTVEPDTTKIQAVQKDGFSNGGAG